MTEAEMQALCRRHGFSEWEGRQVLNYLKRDLLEPPPDGVGLPKDAIGSAAEMAAHLTDVMWKTRPFNGGEFWSTSGEIVAFFRQLAGLPKREQPDPEVNADG